MKNKTLYSRATKYIRLLSLYVAVVLMLVILYYIVYLWSTYIDETITSGHAYGFVIGDSKLETYKKAPKSLAVLKEDDLSVFYETNATSESAEFLAVKPGYKLMVEALLHDVGYPTFKLSDQWDFYVGGSYFNKLSLKFCDDKLCEIYRHRKKFEIP